MSVRFDEATLRRGVTSQVQGVYADDAGRYRCFSCGHVWQRRERTRWWPIRFRLAHWCWGTWRMEVGADRIEQRVMARVVSVGWLRIVFGGVRRPELPQVRAARGA